MPLTAPEEVTVATAVLVMLHTPPVVASVNAVDEPAQTLAVPLMEPADGKGVTVTACTAAEVPQPFVTE